MTIKRNNVSRFLAVALITLGIFGLIGAKNNSPQVKPVTTNIATLLEIKGAIGPAVADFIRRGLTKAARMQAQLVILQIDTPGGLSKSMRDIIQKILASPIPVVSYVAPSGARAASAGTYILYASHVAAMAPGTNLGAATPVSIASPGGGKDKNNKKDKKATQKSASELKAINDAKAYIRSLAQLRKRNVKWAERAVSHGESLSATEALKLNVINLIAKDIPDLLQKINGMKVSVRGTMQAIASAHLQVKKIEPDWRSKFLAIITDPSVAYVLLMLGFYGLFFEFANPGFVVPGVTGAICLLLAMYAFQLLPINYVGLGLIVLGMVFIVAEAFMPSFGILGIGGIISFAIGSVLLFETEAPGFNMPLQVIIGMVVITALVCAGIIFLAVRARRQPVVSGSEGMIGKQGTIEMGAGDVWVRVEGEMWKVANTENLTVGQTVRIVSMQGLVLSVEPI